LASSHQAFKSWLKKNGGPHFVGARLASSQVKNKWTTLCWSKVGLKPSNIKVMTKTTGGPHFVGARLATSQLKNRWATLCWSKVGLKPSSIHATA
jgi:hypothetical protein